jgi:hypothetical protein
MAGAGLVSELDQVKEKIPYAKFFLGAVIMHRIIGKRILQLKDL